MAQQPDGTVPHPAADSAFRKANRPVSAGLYDATREHDACGVGFIVDLKNRPATRSSRTASPSSRTSSIAAPWAPIR